MTFRRGSEDLWVLLPVVETLKKYSGPGGLKRSRPSSWYVVIQIVVATYALRELLNVNVAGEGSGETSLSGSMVLFSLISKVACFPAQLLFPTAYKSTAVPSCTEEITF